MLFRVYVCVPVGVCTCICGYMCMSTYRHVEAQSDTGCLLRFLSTLFFFFKIRSFTESGVHEISNSGQIVSSRDLPASTSSAPRLQMCAIILGF